MSVGVALMWPAVAALGFLALICLVVALGASSTARYEFERNRVPQQQRSAARGASAHPAGSRAATGPADAPGGETRREAVGVAVRPVAPPAGVPSGTGWWLVQDAEDGAGHHVVAGPFPDRLDADWAALAGNLPAVAAHGVLRADGGLTLRPTPEELAWLGVLGEQLDRLDDDWDDLLTDTDPLTTLVVEVAAALVEAGLPLHDCAQRTPAPGGTAGGVCLTPELARGGVLVGWHAHDRMSVEHSRGAYADAAVALAMNAAVTEVLLQLGFAVEASESAGGCLVTALRR
ncbi:hypothetical protein [Geodermatophilus sp. URMC 64]